MTMEFLTYKKFYDQVDVDSVTSILNENGIEFQITQDRESLDSLYGDKQFSRQYFVKIKGSDFQKADSILLDISEKEISQVDKDHYLYSFTDDELIDILRRPDEWNEFDYRLSVKLLSDRGKEIDQKTIESFRQERIKDLSKQDDGDKLWTFLGYVFAVLGGLLGIFIGWHLMTFKKTIPNGQRIYAYTLTARGHGRRILIIGTIMFIVSIILRIATMELD
jgi:hypothetical protein